MTTTYYKDISDIETRSKQRNDLIMKYKENNEVSDALCDAQSDINLQYRWILFLIEKLKDVEDENAKMEMISRDDRVFAGC